MVSAMLGLYGLYLILVGVNGRVGDLVDLLGEDGRGFIPWVFAILVIALLSENEETKKLVGPFIFLLTLTFVLRNFDTVKAELNEIYKLSGA